MIKGLSYAEESILDGFVPWSFLFEDYIIFSFFPCGGQHRHVLLGRTFLVCSATYRTLEKEAGKT